ncbi:MAG: ABC transporter substrate-binding protein [Alphaproteobacteria bacterium]|nr:ABC transporter substrate-binding protein [Alphaproteobacteria bacterium]MCZ6764438.1 ABC transporter substrate-binding protein [Alphaproteobacteria bacterium]
MQDKRDLPERLVRMAVMMVASLAAAAIASGTMASSVANTAVLIAEDGEINRLSAVDADSGELGLVAAPRFVEVLTRHGMSSLGDPSVDRNVRRAQMRDLFYQSFATQKIARVVLGRHWFAASSQERQDFMDVLGGYIADVVIRNLADGNFKIFGTVEFDRPETGTKVYDVNTVLVSEGSSTQIIWSIELIDGEPKVRDLIIEGQSFLLAQRNNFEHILRRNSGSMTALIEAIRPIF